MSAQPLPPLPPNWTEHIGPGGVKYYYNGITQESTYIRPLPAFPIPQAPQAAPQKDKPLTKTPIPGTDWIRVKTVQGKTFYTNKAKKASVWTVPEEIKDAVAALDAEEAQAAAGKAASKQARTDEEKREVARVKAEAQEAAKRKAVDEPVGELVVTKKAKVDEEEEEEEEGSDSDEEEEEEEEWQREAAAQLAKEAEEEHKRREEEERKVKEAEEAEVRKKQDAQLKMPEHVDLSVEEAKALFKTLLREKDVNPLHPWDLSLPLFVNDPRYVLLSSVSARKDAFDEYCRERARELRQPQVKKEKVAANPKEEFERLLKDEVKSTRTSWTDFRRTWKKDRRFYGWGRDDREREKRFRDYLKELGEQKRAAAQKAEADFIALLREKANVQPDSNWKDIKRKLYDDPRYDAVGSSSLREELFNTFKKAVGTGTVDKKEQSSKDKDGDVDMNEQVDEAELERRKKEKQERAVREREEKVRAERQRMEANIARSRQGLTHEEGETQFKVLLVDAIRDPQATWESSQPELQKDPRFTSSPLTLNQQLHLFHAHMKHLRDKHYASLHALFTAHAPSLATTFADLPLDTLTNSQPVTKLGLSLDALQDEFERWQRERTTAARAAFDEMMGENAFVEFWGRLGKIGGEGVDGFVKADEMPEGEGEFGGGTVDMKNLARNVDVREIVKVIKNDKRYLDFDHVPEQREKWIRDYLANLSAPQLSVHLQKR
ncbi:uncharacterized protein SCHCODRAFT_02574650 [Schizophyllum commune H4-8]|uniref:WW domain-containing protein n=1 Tax=Schizophyllum commune (strain H4-8 / FGSC 9210) TaxID=578458 RepID=D8PNX9_SCHCM|nr:uncharacterized protein SCHCODRAFT_02574650 [Schizophyllum commune H4-8]KAI5893292.1 hypothetical protein SCHCODRAFT_02574650 [Schizophyllum commune H4-8]